MVRTKSPHGTCRTCKAPILWVVMESGKKMPLDATPNPEGNICAMLDRHTGEHVGWYAKEGAGAQRYTSHFATCKDAVKWRAKPDGKVRG